VFNTEKLKALIKQRDVKQEELAEAVGITPIYLSYVINGHKKPSFELVVKLARYLNVYVDDLIVEE